MNHALKRIISFAFVLILVMSFATPAFAAGTVKPLKGTVNAELDYWNAESNEGDLYLQIATGTKSFSIKRGDVSLSNNTLGAKLSGFYKDYSTDTYKYQFLNGKKLKTQTTKYANYNYTVYLDVTKPTGSVTINYKIGSKSYSLKLNVTNQVNPLKSVTLTGVKGGKNLVDKTTQYVEGLKLPANVKNAKLKVTPAKGWTVRSVYLTDTKTGYRHALGNSLRTTLANGAVKEYKGLSSATLNFGKLVAADSYTISVNLQHATTGMYKYCYFYINY